MVWIAWDNTFKDGLHSLGHYILLSTLVQGKLLYYQQIVQDIYNTFKDGPDGLGHYILLSILVQGKPLYYQ